MKKRYLSMLMAGMITASILMGCGNNIPQDLTPTEPPTSESSTDENVEADPPTVSSQSMPEFDQATFDEQYAAWKALSEERNKTDSNDPKYRELSWQLQDMEKIMYGPYAGTNLDGAISENDWDGSFMAFKYASDPSYAEELMDYAEFSENLHEGDTVDIYGTPLTITKVYYEDKFDPERVSGYYAETQLGNVIDKDLRQYVSEGEGTAALTYKVDGTEYYCINNYITGLVQSNLQEPKADFLHTWSIPKKEGQITFAPTADVICKHAYTSFTFNDVFDECEFDFGKLHYQYGYGGRYWDTDKILTPDNASTIWMSISRDSDDRYLTVGAVSFIWRDKYGNDLTSAFKVDAEGHPCYPYTYPQSVTFSAAD